MKVTWDEHKNAANKKKHGVSFSEAAELLQSDRDYLEIFDEAHSNVEDRFISIGPITGGVILVVWTERAKNTIRIISARWASSGEVDLYQSHRGSML